MHSMQGKVLSEVVYVEHCLLEEHARASLIDSYTGWHSILITLQSIKITFRSLLVEACFTLST